MINHKKRWSDDEKEYLRKNAGQFTSEYIGLRLRRTAASVRQMARVLGVKFTKGTRWKPEETKFLEDNHENMSPAEIGAVVNHTAQEVRAKAAHLGIKFGFWKKVSDHDVALCKTLFNEGVSIEDIAEKMEIEYGTVKSYVYGWRRKNVTALAG